MGMNGSLCEAVAALAARSSESQRVYLLLDQSGLPAIPSMWPAVKTAPWACVLGCEQAQPDGASPLLVDVSDVHASPVRRRMLGAVHVQGRFANCLSLLVSDMALEALAGALRQRARAQLPDRLPVILRYFDTRTLPLLPRLLSPAQYAGFMSCVRAWHFVDRYGQLRAMESPRADLGSAQFTGPMEFDVAQERMLIDDGTADAVIDQLIEQRHPAFTGSTPAQQFDKVRGPVTAAAALGLSDVHDVLQFCCAALAHGSGFEQRNPWAQRLAEHRRGSMTLEEALADDE